MRQQNNHVDGEEMTEEQIEQAVEEAFPAPDFRQYQKKAIVETVKAFTIEDKDLVLVNAPTGSGKSLILYTAHKALEILDGHSSFFTTPLNSLVDQLDNDEFIGDRLITLKGRNNYNCVNEEDYGTPVDQAICQKDSDFECEVKDECPYYGRKAIGIESPHVVTNMSYIMAESMISEQADNTFGVRNELTVDECQKIEDFAMNYISFTVSRNSVPTQVWQNVGIPDDDYEDDMDYLVKWVEDEVLAAVREVLNYLDSVAVLDDSQLSDKEDLEQFEMRVENFLDDVEENDWIAQIEHEIRKNKPNTKKVVFKPIEIGRFLDDLLWDRGENVILSSATIPGGGWLEEIGLGGAKVKSLPVPSTFPVENRPIICGQAVGKMTKGERKDNAWPMMKMIKRLSDHHDGQKGFIHCRSYNIAEMLKRACTNNKATDSNPFDQRPSKWFRENCMMQDQYNREESLQQWINSDKQIFFSVAMDEGVDLDGDKCRWQVLAKTLYKHMGDKRTRYRVQERGEWDWYNRHAAIQIQQAYGRGVRSPDDECVFYILDSSAKTLIKRNAELFNGWFLEAIQDMDVDPERGR